MLPTSLSPNHPGIQRWNSLREVTLRLSSSSSRHATWSSPHSFHPGHICSVFEKPKSMIFGYKPHCLTMFLGAKSLCSTPQRWIEYNSQNKISLSHNRNISTNLVKMPQDTPL